MQPKQYYVHCIISDIIHVFKKMFFFGIFLLAQLFTSLLFYKSFIGSVAV